MVCCRNVQSMPTLLLRKCLSRIARVLYADIGCANITYEIVAGNTERLFTVDPITGLVLTSGELDRETRDQYLLTGIG